MPTIVPSRVADLPDTVLIEQSRNGGSEAFAELWRRHAAAGRTVARSFTSSLDPDDLVAEAFTRIYTLLQSGRGPTGAFRPYLFTTIRNTASSWGKARRETSMDNLESFEDPGTSEDASIEALDKSLTATAFRSLPTRWQEALWYSEVEGMTPQQIAPLLAMSANSVSALCYRAREGLRQAWIQAHLNSTATAPECRWTIERLGAYTRGSLGQRDVRRVDEHLDNCAKCAIVAAEARETGSRLALVLLPLAAGIGAASAYTSWLQSGAHGADHALGAVAAASMPATITSGGTSSGGSGAVATGGYSPGPSTTIAVLAVVGSVVAVVGVALAVTLAPTPFPSPDETGSSIAAGPAAEPHPPVTESPLAAPAPQPAPPPSDPYPVEPAPPAPLDPPARGPGILLRPVDPAPPPPPPPPVPPIGPVAPITSTVPVAPPLIAGVDTGDGLYFPVIAGTATPGAIVDIYLDDPGHAGAALLSVAVDDAGAWSAIAEVPPGEHVVTATQTVDGNVSETSESQGFELLIPSIEFFPEHGIFGPALVVSGISNSTTTVRLTHVDELLGRHTHELSVPLGENGFAVVPLTEIGDMETATDNLFSSEYDDGAGRHGASVSLPFR
ncbi:sigma-70 family RNA polymerase sigma factor [Luethyella okanaganae]|uniref:Sigma-70 family RNA polymerase sigma factor n=1 Tax=Luethyella okanaganae TaxID=69372 RepID=A0ABW1VJL1_9MICO